MSASQYPTTAIILAAGQGTRLLPYTIDKPKCMLTFENLTLIEIQIKVFRAHGVENIVVVTGYKGILVENLLGRSVKYIYNERYEETSSMYSLWLARGDAMKGCFVLNSDVLFHPEILKNLIESSSPNALAMDFDSVLNEEEMKVKVRNGRVVSLSKSFKDADGENVGLLKFDDVGMGMIFETIERFINEGNLKLMVPSAVDAVAKKLFIEAVPVNGLPWIEIDFPEDYQKASLEIFPKIKETCPSFL